MLHIGTLSSGAASAYTCKLMLDEVGKKDSLMIFTDTLWEDADNYRFLTDIVKHLDAPFKRLAVGKNPLELAWSEKALPSNRIAFCSRKLKREPLEDYIKEHCSNQDVTIWWGIDIEEKHRAVKIEANWLANFNIKSRFPLIENLTPRYEVFDWLESIDIKPPIMYEQKFSHANCFSGDTRFITKDGIKTFQETVDTDVKVVGTYGNWVDASVKNFGNQEIVELTLERLGKTKVIKTTANHEWFVWKGNRCKVHTTKVTNELEVNDRLRVVIPKGLSKNVDYKTSISSWRVVSVKPTGITEPVFCCVVSDGNAFTLEDNILTHNCGGRCVRAGLSHWAHLYEVNPERYKEVECLEQKWQHDFQKNNTILRKSGKPISLRDFRINHIEGGVLFPEDVSDGACGCMATFEGDST